MAKRAKPFKYWSSDEVENTFGIKRVYQLDLMDEWLKNDRQLPSESASARLLILQATIFFIW
jgi:glucuronate isomerase